MIMEQSLSTQTFHLKHRGNLIAQGVIFLLFTGSCIVQAVVRIDVDVEKFWNTWWFFAILSLGFLYFTMEAFYKIFFTRLVLSPDEVVLYDFPKKRRLEWKEVKKIGEINFKDKKKDFGFLLKDSTMEKDGMLAVPIISLTPFFTSWNESPIKQWLKDNKPGLVK